MKIGCAKVDITPYPGIKLGGYEGLRTSDGVLDKLYARIIAINEDSETHILVSLDLVAVDYNFISLLSKHLKSSLKIDRERLFVNSTHTHSGPAGIMKTSGFFKSFTFVFGEYDRVYTESIIKKITQGVGIAISDMDYCDIRYCQYPYSDLGKSRIDKALPVDTTLSAINFRKQNGENIIIYNYPCHPTILNSDNKKISGDYPGVVSSIMERVAKLAFFMNGACGDISTRFTRRESTYEEVNHMSYGLINSIKSCCASSWKLAEPYALKSTSFTVRLKLKELPSKEALKEELLRQEEAIKKLQQKNSSQSEIRLISAKKEGIVNLIHLKEGCKNLCSVPIKLSALRIADVVFVYIPGELFNSLGSYIKKELQGCRVIICCYGGGYMGYIPDSSVYAAGGYEVSSTPFEKGQGEYLVKSIVEKIKEELI